MAELCDIRWLDVTESTQDVLLGSIGAYDNMSVVAARLQTAGRGQRGNRWLAGKGENLTFSMLLKFGGDGFPALKATGQFAITRAATVGIAGYLESEGICCRIKWPNDIYAGDRKICGMLVENILRDGFLHASVVGIGLNVNQKVFPGELVNPVSMAMLTGRGYDTEAELGKVCSHLATALRRFLNGEGDYASYESRLYRLNEFHEYTDCSDWSVFEGRIVGTRESGLLCVEKRNGELKEFAFKEISYII